jgi:hypothetical protein
MKIRSGLLAAFFCILYISFLGCQHSREYSYIAEDISSYRNKKVTAVTLKNGDTHIYDKGGGHYIEERRDSVVLRKIVGFDDANHALNVDLDKILEVQSETQEADGSGTIILTSVLLVVGSYLLVLLLFSGWH